MLADFIPEQMDRKFYEVVLVDSQSITPVVGCAL